ncbi:MAG: hypothetical protein ABJM06_00140 [Gilvibacter sp.]
MKSLWLLLFICLPLQAQQLVLQDSVALKADRFIGKDNYDNLYFIKNNSLHKRNNGATISYADMRLGGIESVDIINPLKVLVYYADFNTVVLLDNTLNEIERINFNEVEGFANIDSVRMANNNSLWVFNQDNQQLELYNYRSGKRTLISQPIAGNVISVDSSFNFYYLLTTEQVVSFNVYGSILEQYRNPNFEVIWQYKNSLIGLGADGKFYFNATLNEYFELPADFSKNTQKQLQLNGDFLYIYDGDFVFTFKLT